MSRISKIDYQMHCRMDQMKCIGESRHDAIKQTRIEFIKYLRTENKDIQVRNPDLHGCKVTVIGYVCQYVIIVCSDYKFKIWCLWRLYD